MDKNVKILDASFRQGLYKDLVDAGYEKVEAQTIVGKKYYTTLRKNVSEELDELKKSVEDEVYGETDFTSLQKKFDELYKMYTFLNPDTGVEENKEKGGEE